MPVLLAAALMLQAAPDESLPEPAPRSGLQAGLAFLRLDSAIGAEDGILPGFEIAFHMSKPEPKYAIGLRAYYRTWDVKFEQFNQADADLDGEAQQLGLDLVVTYPIAGPLTLGVELGGGGLRLEHDLDKEDSLYVDDGAFLRLDLFAGLYL